MKSLKQIDKELGQAAKVLGFDPRTVEQGTDEWLKMKLGVISASNAYKVLSNGKTRETYMMELVGQVCTGLYPEITAKSLQWGKEQEPKALAAIRFLTGKNLHAYPLIYKDSSMRAGCSPDGLDEECGDEIKNPETTKEFIRFAALEKLPHEYYCQCQFSMWITGRPVWHITFYDERMKKNPLFTRKIERNETTMKMFDIEVLRFVREMDEILASLGFTFGEQWGHENGLPEVQSPATVPSRRSKAEIIADIEDLFLAHYENPAMENIVKAALAKAGKDAANKLTIKQLRDLEAELKKETNHAAAAS